MKKPRNHTNYPNQMVSVGFKIQPDVFDWIDEHKLEFRIARSTLASKMITFAYEHEQELIEYLKNTSQPKR